MPASSNGVTASNLDNLDSEELSKLIIGSEHTSKLSNERPNSSFKSSIFETKPDSSQQKDDFLAVNLERRCANALPNGSSETFYKLSDCDCGISDSVYNFVPESSNGSNADNLAKECKTSLSCCNIKALASGEDTLYEWDSPSTAQTPVSCESLHCVNRSQQENRNGRQQLRNFSNGFLDGLESFRTNCQKKNVKQDDLQIWGWQSTKSSIKERIAHMCMNNYLADVFFNVNGEDSLKQKIPAHKFVLAIGSVVFDKMFNYESSACFEQAQEIDIIDVEVKAFTSLLTFLYKDEVLITADSVMATLYAAKKYAVPALEFVCVNFLKEKLNSENAFMLLAQSRLFDETNLMENCLEIIDRDTSEALQADGFLEIDHDTLCAVLQRDALRIDELPLFQAIVRWSIENCKRKELPLTVKNQRNVLNGALQLIRYTEMSITEFSDNVATSKLLTDDEVVSIFLHFTATSPPPIVFPTTQRRRFVGKQMCINRFQRVEASWGYSGTPDRIKFSVDASIWVLGFGLYGSVNDCSNYSVTIEIINFGSGQILAHNDCTFQSDGSNAIYPVKFKKPVEIAANISYIASARLIGAETHYGSKGLRRIVLKKIASPSSSGSLEYCESNASNSITFQFAYASGKNNGTSVDDGQIPQIIFCEKF